MTKFKNFNLFSKTKTTKIGQPIAPLTILYEWQLFSLVFHSSHWSSSAERYCNSFREKKNSKKIDFHFETIVFFLIFLVLLLKQQIEL